MKRIMADLSEAKKNLRRQMKTRRDEAAAQNPKAGLALCDQLLPHLKNLPPHSIVATYHAMGSEIDPQPLIDALRSQGHSIALPVVTGKGEPLVFRRYEPGAALAASSFGVAEPLPSAPIVTPHILLVPMLAFDCSLYRLGYGGGFYDRTLMKLRSYNAITAIGLAFACQEVATVPHGPHDAQLDKIVTETHALGR